MLRRTDSRNGDGMVQTSVSKLYIHTLSGSMGKVKRDRWKISAIHSGALTFVYSRIISMALRSKAVSSRKDGPVVTQGRSYTEMFLVITRNISV